MIRVCQSHSQPNIAERAETLIEANILAEGGERDRESWGSVAAGPDCRAGAHQDDILAGELCLHQGGVRY